MECWCGLVCWNGCNDDKIVTSVVYGEITSTSMKVDLFYKDGSFHTDYPIYNESYGHALFDVPEYIPEDIRKAVNDIFRYTADYEVHLAQLMAL